ncbi:unnamed protein product [Rotaria socialis]|uniref:Uncharacterized protein n=1 Tax=Rotaria socialis TaxID=392032 RepID=A0A820MF28_9BILA|nr:unnamed protein product [Rotaria socialis]
MMNDEEYIFNYEEVKRIFESVPQSISMTRKLTLMPYNTHFQPRTKTKIEKKDIRSTRHTLQTNEIHPRDILEIPNYILQDMIPVNKIDISFHFNTIIVSLNVPRCNVDMLSSDFLRSKDNLTNGIGFAIT